jgi:hypothetical protein
MSPISYLHLHLSLFYRHIFDFNDDGLTYKNKFYPWNEINNIEVWQEAWPGVGHYYAAKYLPRAWINFKDGVSIFLRGDVLVKKQYGVSYYSYENNFNELITKIKDKDISSPNGPK